MHDREPCRVIDGRTVSDAMFEDGREEVPDWGLLAALHLRVPRTATAEANGVHSMLSVDGVQYRLESQAATVDRQRSWSEFHVIV